MKTMFRLVSIENQHAINASTDSDFLFLMQRAVLMGLKEAGSLSELQYRHAEESLLKQYRENIRAAVEFHNT